MRRFLSSGHWSFFLQLQSVLRCVVVERIFLLWLLMMLPIFGMRQLTDLRRGGDCGLLGSVS